MLHLYKQSMLGEFDAALCMLNDCLTHCPDDQWDQPVAKYPFWHVAYHTLCYVDCYLSPSNDDFKPSPEFHPKGMEEFEAEHPSRRFTREELLKYAAFCREKLGRSLVAETETTLAGPSGFPWLKFTRAELHLYNIRHIAHHTGQLGAFLRRAGVELRWVKSGWVS
jgi:hypothetical protein